MSRVIAYVGLLSLMLVASPARAANKLIAVLPLDVRMTAGKLSKEAQASLEEMLRDVATNALSPYGWTVLTGETTLQVLQDNGVDPTKCGSESCHLSMAREIKADKFLSGAVEYVEGEFTASIRLIDTGTGRILASEALEGKSVLKLRKDFERKATVFFTRAGLLPAASGQPAPTQAAQAQPAPVATESKPADKLPPIVVLKTTMGDITLELDREKAPVTVNNFLRYVNEHFYDGTIFHRVINGFMIQGGGYTADLVEKPTREPIRNEGQNGLKNVRGSIAMARLPDPDSATAQFFINVTDNTALDYPTNGGYAVFGKVVSGMDVVDRIKAVRTGQGSNGMSNVPVIPIVIEAVVMK